MDDEPEPDDELAAAHADQLAQQEQRAQEEQEEQDEQDEIERILKRQQRRRKSVLGAAMLGLHDAIYGPQEQKIVIMASNDGMPEPDFDVQLTPDPRDSVVIMRKRRWRDRD